MIEIRLSLMYAYMLDIRTTNTNGFNLDIARYGGPLLMERLNCLVTFTPEIKIWFLIYKDTTTATNKYMCRVK